MTTGESYKLDELAAAAGVSARTVRYYVQRGLLPGPVFRGKDSAYDQGHLVRLRAIKRLQEAFLPLDAIQAELSKRSLEEIEKLADGEPLAASPLAPSPIAQAPLAPPPKRGGPDAQQWTKWTLAPGLELTLSHDAAPEVRALAEALLARARRLD